MRQPDRIDVTCTPMESSLTCLTRGATAGLTMKVAASLLSLGSILYAFLFIVYVNRHTLRSGIHIFRNKMDILVFSLLWADFLQAIGGLLNVKWILDGVVEVGPFCDTQGILIIFGTTGIAMSTLLIAAYTFVVITTGRSFTSMRTTVAIVAGTWILIAILVGVGHAANHDPSKSRYISPTPYWCWLGKDSDYMKWKMGSEYLWLWTMLFVSPLLYTPLYLWMRGNLVFRESVWYKWSFQSRNSSDPFSIHRKAWVMLLYPVVTYVCIFPASLARWIAFMEVNKYGASTFPSAANFAASTIFNLSGFFNVILVFTTKPNLGLFGQQERTSLGRAPSPLSVRPETEVEDVELSVKGMSSQV